jgi:hypothetical protein
MENTDMKMHEMTAYLEQFRVRKQDFQRFAAGRTGPNAEECETQVYYCDAMIELLEDRIEGLLIDMINQELTPSQPVRQPSARTQMNKGGRPRGEYDKILPEIMRIEKEYNLGPTAAIRKWAELTGTEIDGDHGLQLDNIARALREMKKNIGGKTG